VVPGRHGNEPLHRIELSPQILEPTGLFLFELLEMLFELGFGRVDLLLEPIGAVLEVAPDVTH
jgi:hypothetical protein